MAKHSKKQLRREGSDTAQSHKVSTERVGYRNPPQEHQWKKGESGNPSGRPSRKNSWADLFRELERLVTVSEGGKRKRMTRQQLILRQVVAKAAQGDPKSLGFVLQAMKYAEEPMLPQIEKGKAYEYAKQKISQFIYEQRKAGYEERMEEERGERKPEPFWGRENLNDPVEPESGEQPVGNKSTKSKKKGQES